jgi:hypothetical protein
VAAEAEHVRPGGQPQLLELGKVAETEACGDVAAGVLTDGQVSDPVGRGEAAIESASAFGGLGRVLGHVRGDLGIGHVTVGGDRADVELAAPRQGAGRESWRGGSRDAYGTGGLVDGSGEQRDGDPGGRGVGWPGRAVEPDDGVEVDDAAALVFGDLGVGDPELRGEGLAGESGLAGQGPAQGDGEPSSQFGGADVEQHRPGVVVAVWTERLAEPVVLPGVLLRARQTDAVLAGLVFPARSAGQDPAVFLPSGVDRAERRRGERDEHAGMVGDGGGDALAAGQSGADELVCVGAVDLGAGRAAGGAAGLACDRQDAAGFVDGGVAVDQFAGAAVDVIGAAAQQNRLQAPSGVPDGACGDMGGQRRYSSRRGGRAEACSSQADAGGVG